MNDLEHILDRAGEFLSVGSCLGIRQTGEIFDVSDQMGDTELNGDVEIVL